MAKFGLRTEAVISKFWRFLTVFSGHNGVKSVIEALRGDKGFKKLLIGIDRPVSRDPEDVAKYVLSRFRREELEVIRSTTFPDGVELMDKLILQESGSAGGEGEGN